MKKQQSLFIILLLTLTFLIFGISSVGATIFTGDLSVKEGSLIATEEWNNNDTIFSWRVDNEQSTKGYWTYDYTWFSTTKDISHLDIEVSQGSFDQIIDSWNAVHAIEGKPFGPITHTEFGDKEIYGIKWDLGEDSKTFNLTLVSPRNPMWGDIYAKDGGGKKTPVYAVNNGFGSDPTDPISNGNLYNSVTKTGGWALVPDTTAVPIPGAVWLLGSGLLGLLGFRKKRKS